MLQVDGLHVAYQSVTAVHDLSLRVEKGQIIGLVGANGAGKTSTLNAITRLIPYRGRVALDGQELGGLKTADIVRRGLVQVAQGRQLFPDMSVLENLELGGFLQSADSTRAMAEKMFNQFPVLKERATQPAGTLSGGEQQMLAVARALMSKPNVLLVDEPCLGLSPKMVARLAEVIAQVRDGGISVLLVEQNTAFVFGLAQHIYVIENGRVVLAGSPGELRQNDKVRSAYLGI